MQHVLYHCFHSFLLAFIVFFIIGTKIFMVNVFSSFYYFYISSNASDMYLLFCILFSYYHSNIFLIAMHAEIVYQYFTSE